MRAPASTRHPTSHRGSRRQKGRLGWTLRIWSGLLLLWYCALIVYTQRTRAGTLSLPYPREEIMMGNPMEKQRSSDESPRRKKLSRDHLLSKYYNLTAASRRYTKVEIPDADRSIAFLHIGKTGGSTISMHIRNGCRQSDVKPCLLYRKDGWIPNETVASLRIEGYYHIEDIPPDRNYTTILTVVRNPISRFLSAFAYEHPANAYVTRIVLTNDEKQRYACFHSIGDLVSAAMGRPRIPFVRAHIERMSEKKTGRHRLKRYSKDLATSSRFSNKGKTPLINCTELAQIAFGMNASWAVVNASHPWLNHMSFDYRQYYRSMTPDKELIVIRHDRLWEDWADVNRLLGEGNDAYDNWPDVPPFRDIQRNASGMYRTKSMWKIRTSMERERLCELLREEVRTYLAIVGRAVNLDDEDLREAAADVDETCVQNPAPQS